MEPDNTKLLAAEANPDVGVVVDAPHTGAPVIIAFGFVDWEAPGRFDFARRLRKLDQAGGQPLNLILVRDIANLWYQHGVNGLGPDVHSSAAALRGIVASLKPTSVGTIGQSMGGYAAVLFGALLKVNKVLAFGPLSYMRSDWARRDDDTRWLAIMEWLDRFPPPHRIDDLPALLASMSPPPMHLVYGTAPEPSGPANRDDLHAQRYSALPTVSVETIPEAGHAVVEWLIQQDRIDQYVRHHLLDSLADPALRWDAPAIAPPASEPVAHTPWNDGWRKWIAENVALGAGDESITQTLVEKGFHPGEARREIYKAARSPYHVPLARLLELSRR